MRDLRITSPVPDEQPIGSDSVWLECIIVPEIETRQGSDQPARSMPARLCLLDLRRPFKASSMHTQLPAGLKQTVYTESTYTGKVAPKLPRPRRLCSSYSTRLGSRPSWAGISITRCSDGRTVSDRVGLGFQVRGVVMGAPYGTELGWDLKYEV
ncbi:hypothetical protein J6590_009488 [Homalodisca vitripennis]|nr:hypothetical protein J6590_009488 [Homalodisca vitripennis]